MSLQNPDVYYCSRVKKGISTTTKLSSTRTYPPPPRAGNDDNTCKDTHSNKCTTCTMGVILFTNCKGMIKRDASLAVITAEVNFNTFILTQFTNKGSIIKSSINLNKTLLPFWH